MKAELDERKLVASVLARDRMAFEDLIRQYERLVVHIVGSLVRDETDREDISQDVFLKVYEKLYGFQFRSKLSTWIGNIAYNTSINFLKRKKTVFLNDLFESCPDGDSPSYEERWLKDRAPDPETLLIGKEESRLLEIAVEHLPAIQKTLLLLFHQDELSLQEIGVIVEMPINTVKSHLFRARANLKGALLSSTRTDTT